MNYAHLVVVCALLLGGGVASASERSQFAPDPQPAAVDAPTLSLDTAAPAAAPGEFDAGALADASPLPAAGFAGAPEPTLAADALAEEEICQPEIVDSRIALQPSCLNLIEDMNKRGNRVNASAREKRERPSLCDSMWLPRCRHKY